MIYELRIYHVLPGKMQAVCDRFRDKAFPLWPKYGIKATEFWVDAEEKDILYYVCEFDSVTAMKENWAAFLSSAEWKAISAETEKDGPLINRVETYIMKNASFFSR